MQANLVVDGDFLSIHRPIISSSISICIYGMTAGDPGYVLRIVYMLANFPVPVNSTFHKIVLPQKSFAYRFVGNSTKAPSSPFFRYGGRGPEPSPAGFYCFSSTTVTPSSPSPYRPSRKDFTAR